MKKRKDFCPAIFLLALNLLFAGQLIASGVEGNEERSSAKDILTGNTPAEKLFIFRKFNFIDNVLANSNPQMDSTNSALSFELKSQQPLFYLTKDELHKIRPHGPDPFGEELQRKIHDVPPTIPLFTTHLLDVPDSFESHPQTSLSQLPIPTELEIEALKVLWLAPGASGSEIFAQLDTITRIASEDLQKILERMAKRGFLARQKISPSHRFTLFGLVFIEMSSQNRRNKLYRYWPMFAKSQLLRYLDAKRYLAMVSSETTSAEDGKSAYQKSLEKKLYRLVE